MSPSINKGLEMAANLAILVVALLLAVVLIKSYFLAGGGQTITEFSDKPPAAERPTVSSVDIDWSGNGRTLLLAVSSGCRFCTESAPFYRRLAERKHNTRLVALVPQSIADGRKYLEELGVEVDQIKQIPLHELGVTGTPTLIVVDSSGTVTGFWIGKLSTDQEAAVLSALG